MKVYRVWLRQRDDVGLIQGLCTVKARGISYRENTKQETYGYLWGALEKYGTFYHKLYCCKNFAEKFFEYT